MGRGNRFNVKRLLNVISTLRITGYISDVDDRDYLTALIKATIPALPKPKLKVSPWK